MRFAASRTFGGRVRTIVSKSATITERPILFSAPMVRAILDGRKTQTRRVVKPQPLPSTRFVMGPFDGRDWTFGTRCVSEKNDPYNFFIEQETRCPYGTVGDRLWVRETWAPDVKAGNRQVCYAADGRWGSLQASGGIIFHGWTTDVTNKTRNDWAECNGRWVGRVYFQAWKPSIHMPRAASRITLEITGVRVERVQEISSADCIAEGLLPTMRNETPAKTRFRELWDSLNAKRGYGWDANPWVWVIEFKRIETR